jgi:hypothetical protein
VVLESMLRHTRSPHVAHPSPTTLGRASTRQLLLSLPFSAVSPRYGPFRQGLRVSQHDPQHHASCDSSASRGWHPRPSRRRRGPITPQYEEILGGRARPIRRLDTGGGWVARRDIGRGSEHTLASWRAQELRRAKGARTAQRFQCTRPHTMPLSWEPWWQHRLRCV